MAGTTIGRYSVLADMNHYQPFHSWIGFRVLHLRHRFTEIVPHVLPILGDVVPILLPGLLYLQVNEARNVVLAEAGPIDEAVQEPLEIWFAPFHVEMAGVEPAYKARYLCAHRNHVIPNSPVGLDTHIPSVINPR